MLRFLGYSFVDRQVLALHFRFLHLEDVLLTPSVGIESALNIVSAFIVAGFWPCSRSPAASFRLGPQWFHVDGLVDVAVRGAQTCVGGLQDLWSRCPMGALAETPYGWLVLAVGRNVGKVGVGF